MQISFKLLDSTKQIETKILDALLPDIQQIMSRAMNKIKNGLPRIIHTYITNSPEYESLLHGKLKYDFGIPNPETKLASLLNIWSTNIVFDYQQPSIVGSKIRSSFSASMIKADFSDVLYGDFAAVVDTQRGYTLPWLEWLLLEGNKIIVKNYNVFVGPNKGSRTGFAVMKPFRKSWSVPSEFAGTIGDNWITRAIDNAAPEIEQLIDGALS